MYCLPLPMCDTCHASFLPPPLPDPVETDPHPPRRCQVMDEHRRAMLAVATSLYDLLQCLTELGQPARIVQRAYRSHNGRNLLALSRHEVGIRRVIPFSEGCVLGGFRASRDKWSKGSVQHVLRVLSSSSVRGDEPPPPASSTTLN